MMQAETGFGKTFTAARFARHIVTNGKSVMFTAHRQEIYLQAIEHFARVLEAPAGREDDPLFKMRLIATKQLQSLVVGEMIREETIHRHAANGGVMMAMIDTLKARFRRAEKSGGHLEVPDYLIIDEAHHAMAPGWLKVITHFHAKGCKIVGLTATPERLDGKGLSQKGGGIFKTLIQGPPMLELIEKGHLSPLRLFCPPNAVYVPKNTPKTKGDYTASALDELSKDVIGDAIVEYKKIMSGKRALAFCISIARCKEYAGKFNEAGIPADYIDGTMSARERKAKLDALRTGEILILCSRDVIGEGMDIPCVDGAILLRATDSLGLFMQQVGRTARIYSGKEFGVILDMVQNSFRHGHPCQPKKYRFDGCAGGDDDGEVVRVSNVKICSYCTMPNPRTAAVCVNEYCRMPFIKKEPSQRVMKGELVEVGLGYNPATGSTSGVSENVTRWQEAQAILRKHQLPLDM